MEGLEATEITYKESKLAEVSFRLDSEFFSKDILRDFQKIEETYPQKLGKLYKRIDVGYVGSMVSQYQNTGINLLQTKNVDEFFINDQEPPKISIEFHNQLTKSQIRNGDILIARSGSFGKASIFLEDQPTNSADIIII